MLRTCKDIAGLTVTSFGTVRKETSEALRTDLFTLFAELKCWYGSTYVTFITLGVEARNTLVETLAKTNLQTLRQSLTEHLVLTITLSTRLESHLSTTR